MSRRAPLSSMNLFRRLTGLVPGLPRLVAQSYTLSNNCYAEEEAGAADEEGLISKILRIISYSEDN